MSTTRKDGRGKRAAARQSEVSESPLVKRLAMERKDPYACFKEVTFWPTASSILRLPSSLMYDAVLRLWTDALRLLHTPFDSPLPLFFLL